ncbi:hypothetical protein [Brevundimonas sp. TWP2-3-4b1]|uniref:hypothetical protein n=1 Tax=Brevundimonas sp. TWP2-3-4b1 TaxID=2804580 RepID=UPI003CF3CBBE
MTYFDEADVTDKYKVTPEALDDWTKATPIAFPKPEIIDGQKMWTGEDLTMWDTCRLLERIDGAVTRARDELDGILTELYSM